MLSNCAVLTWHRSFSRHPGQLGLDQRPLLVGEGGGDQPAEEGEDPLPLAVGRRRGGRLGEGAVGPARARARAASRAS